ncbi:peptidoglycan-binding protein [Sulfurifustis variabilis]|uniref:Peptidoglycan-binding protein n=1 Tax=Sulfurifustis variabilis TaxID=1675686 RepID=A0A1B4VBG2_9GAMM|nr:AAA family ATPase [Sulfurifustis variabilis]BAU47951.1 peptidoglycan-binding protein [Sulfurifustis variabilis]
MYTQYFGLRENPFALPPDPRYLYLSLRHQEALAHLMYGITQAGGFVQLTGEVGTGKTMMIRALLERLPENVDVALILYPFLSVEEFVTAILDEFRIPRPERPESLKVLIDALNRFLIENHGKGRRTVLIIDEAQKLSREVLEQIRLLTNLETTKEKLLQILLVGQPELDHVLAQPDLRQLAQRITARYNLKSLLPKETAEYVIHRLRVAGAKQPIFTRSAIALLHRLSGGTPRLINVICDRALLGAYGLGRNVVTSAMVRRGAQEIGRAAPRRYAIAAGIAAIALLAAGLGGWQLSARLTPAPAAPEAIPVEVAPAPPPVAGGEPATANGGAAAETATEPAPARVEDLFNDPAIALDTESALAALFAQWRRDYARLEGKTGCQRAQSIGMRCVYGSGNWNRLRQLDRPAVIELLDAEGRRHHVLVTGIGDERVALEIGGKAREYAIADLDRYWYGKYLSLWTPPPGRHAAFKRGMRGPGVVWLRQALARFNGEPMPERASEVFDRALEEQVKAFQRRHGLDDDGIAGRGTLIHLDVYDGGRPTPRLARLARESS